MYEKLIIRLSAFYLNCEKIKMNGGMTEQQQEVIRKSGFTHEYRVRLHRCLRELLIHIVNEKKMDLKLRQLRKTYEWFFHKLVAMGALSQQEIEAELGEPGLLRAKGFVETREGVRLVQVVGRRIEWSEPDTPPAPEMIGRVVLIHRA